MNYIRYWQASGESLKTSIRTKTRLGQIIQEGRFRGGRAPYGYKLVKNGRLGKKNRELYDIEVNPDEVKAIVTIFDLADRYGYGGRKISTELYHQGLINERTGEPFHYSSIQNILRNIMYVGILRSGETKSEIFPELQIITQEQFERVQKGREQRSADYEKKCAEAWQREVTLENGEAVTVSRPERMYPIYNRRCSVIRAECSRGTISPEFADAAKALALEHKQRAQFDHEYAVTQYEKDMEREKLYHDAEH